MSYSSGTVTVAELTALCKEHGQMDDEHAALVVEALFAKFRVPPPVDEHAFVDIIISGQRATACGVCAKEQAPENALLVVAGERTDGSIHGPYATDAWNAEVSVTRAFCSRECCERSYL